MGFVEERCQRRGVADCFPSVGRVGLQRADRLADTVADLAKVAAGDSERSEGDPEVRFDGVALLLEWMVVL